jgi:hypothetical protein
MCLCVSVVGKTGVPKRENAACGELAESEVREF